MKNQTLMIVDPGLRLWGSERALAATLQALTQAWGRVVLVTPQGAELATEVRSCPNDYGPVQIMHAPIGMLHKRSRAAKLRAMAALGVLALRVRPSRIYLNQAGLIKVLWLLCRALRRPLVVHLRLIDDVPRAAKLNGSARVSLSLIAVSRAMLTNSNLADDSHRQLIVAYDPYPLVDASPPQMDLDKPEFVILSRLSYLKGVHLLIGALNDPRLLKARAVVYGAGVDQDPYADDLRVQAAPFDGRVTFEGFQLDVKARLPGHRFLVLTSAYETLGRVVIEAWEAGLVPIVYARSGGAAEIVAASGGGLIFDDWDASSLASVLAQAMAMPEDARKAVAAAGRTWAEQELGLERYRATLSGLLF